MSDVALVKKTKSNKINHFMEIGNHRRLGRSLDVL